MASFYAELRVAGYVFRIWHCTYGSTQDTDGHGRAIAKVRNTLAEFVLDVPDHNFLEGWANDPLKRLPAEAVFSDATNRTLETMRFEAAYCVGYQEFFASGDTAGGSYQCRVTLSDPDGWHWQPGGPAPTPQALQQNPFVLPQTPVVPPVPLPPVEVPVPPAPLGLLARLLALLPELGVAAAVAVLVPTNSRDDPGYQSEWDFIRRNTPPTDRDRAELADLERRHADGTLTADEEAHLLALLALLARVKGLRLQQLADLRTLPSRPPNPTARPRGIPARIDPRDELVKQQAIIRENETANIMAQAGYDVEQNPVSPNPPKKPDYRIEGKIFDNYAPTSSSVRNIWSNTGVKVSEEQTRRVVLNLRGSEADVSALAEQFKKYPIPDLEEVVIINKAGEIIHILPNYGT
ncbi:type VI secretion system tube protein TssD [Hymenobacter terrenus]|uniref:type VI secretion system tube protein TssD n=1 Tax=Hymenobacter terrenus TaxID=1629124 RepID=UPI00069650F6|nr:type VI secretion system tube protein TssD [Hymenobacter terrenus]